MSELDDFRPRLRNWANVYRTRFIRQESNLMAVIRALEACNQVATQEVRRAPDARDAAFIDECILELRHKSVYFERDYPVLKAEYLTGYSSSTFESAEDERKATRYRARYAQVFAFMYNDILERLEIQLMRYVHKREDEDAGKIGD